MRARCGDVQRPVGQLDDKDRTFQSHGVSCQGLPQTIQGIGVTFMLDSLQHHTCRIFRERERGRPRQREGDRQRGGDSQESHTFREAG